MIEIIKQRDNYNREVWCFYWENEYHIWLDEYRIQHREVGKRKWEDVKFYTRIGDIRRTMSKYLLQEKDVPLTNELIAHVREWIVEHTQIKYWSDR